MTNLDFPVSAVGACVYSPRHERALLTAATPALAEEIAHRLNLSHIVAPETEPAPVKARYFNAWGMEILDERKPARIPMDRAGNVAPPVRDKGGEVVIQSGFNPNVSEAVIAAIAATQSQCPHGAPLKYPCNDCIRERAQDRAR